MDHRVLFPFNPPEASSVAGTVDTLFAIEFTIALLMTCVIFVLIAYFSIRYRRRSEFDRPPRVSTHFGLEATWTGLTFLVFTCYYFLGAGLFAREKQPPQNAQIVYVVGKQWMWKMQGEDGTREINTLHVPVGRAIKLIMSSQDVIHSFYVPAFRIKEDVVPGTYTSLWFVATRPGAYHLFCAEYCGTDHARMVGQVVVLSAKDYAAWRAGTPPAESPALTGRKLFVQYGCASCHGQVAPSLAGLYMSKVTFADGSTGIADENYLVQSILDSPARVVAGYPVIMPSFRGQLTPEQVNDLVAYIKSLKSAKGPGAPGPLINDLQNFPPAHNAPDVLPPPGSGAGTQ